MVEGSLNPSEELLADVRRYLPKFLSPTRTDELYDALRFYPEIPSFYLSPGMIDEELLQGDGWRGFVLRDFQSGEARSVSRMIISNSCDVDLTNERIKDTNVLFCPLVSVAKFQTALLESGIEQGRVTNILSDIRKQRWTSAFHLPSGQHGPDECVAWLDDIHPAPLRTFHTTERAILFRLQHAAFYVLLIKLSIHFCRMQEDVERFESATP
jgi:hypothetical protein